MDTQEGKGDEKGCCTKSKCCTGKALAALALLLVGGVGGYFAGKNCGKVCPVREAVAPVQPAAK